MKLLLALFLLFMTDEKRLVLLFYTEDGSKTLSQQVEEFKKNKAGIQEREIEIRPYKLSPANAEMWKKWGIDKTRPFTFILVGKDGGEKHRSNQVVSHKDLFGKIDAMPMRRSEIRKP